ncbi:hypothetical protein QUB68_06885 [Microcoleus sp. A006_D1]
MGTLIAGWDNSGHKTEPIDLESDRQPTVYDLPRVDRAQAGLPEELAQQ